jgi:hypothetical protein
MTWANPSLLRLFHGTVDLHMGSIQQSVNVTVGRIIVDFWQGLYTTTNFVQAIAHARNILHRFRPCGARAAVVAIFTIDRHALSSLPSLSFVLPTSDFWDLIDWCRAGNRTHHAGGYYDVVSGSVVEDFRRRLIHSGYDQVSFHNPGTVSVLGAPQWSIVP